VRWQCTHLPRESMVHSHAREHHLQTVRLLQGVVTHALHVHTLLLQWSHRISVVNRHSRVFHTFCTWKARWFFVAMSFQYLDSMIDVTVTTSSSSYVASISTCLHQHLSKVVFSSLIVGTWSQNILLFATAKLLVLYVQKLVTGCGSWEKTSCVEVMRS